MIQLDDAGDPTAATTNARRLATEDKVDILIGSAVTPATIAVAGVAYEAAVPHFALSPMPFQPGREKWTFVMPQPVPLMAKGIFENMKAKGAKRVGIIGFSDSWGDLWVKEFKASAEPMGLEMIADERYARADTSVAGQVLKLVAARPDAVLVGASGTAAALPVIALRERGYTGPIYQTHGAVTRAFIGIAGKSADVVVNWMPDALAAREAGVPLVNIAQVFDKSGLMLTCKKSAGVSSPKDLKGKTLGVWYGGNEYPFLNWMTKLGYKPGSDIKILKQGFNVDPLLQNQAACISTMIYNEYWQVIDAGIKESDLIPCFYEKEGVASLEDGLYVLDSKLKDKAFVAKMAKFLKATFKGWNDAVKNPEEAAKVVVAADPSGSAKLAVQKRQMENVAKLISNAGTPKIGYLDPAAYERTVKVQIGRAHV